MEANNVFRALRPKMAFEKPDGSVSSAAFKDKRGLSVEVDGGRSDFVVINTMHSYLEGNIVKIGVSVCEANDVEIYNDFSSNKYHRLLLNKRRNEGDYCLTPIQCAALAAKCELIKMNIST